MDLARNPKTRRLYLAETRRGNDGSRMLLTDLSINRAEPDYQGLTRNDGRQRLRSDQRLHISFLHDFT